MDETTRTHCFWMRLLSKSNFSNGKLDFTNIVEGKNWCVFPWSEISGIEPNSLKSSRLNDLSTLFFDGAGVDREMIAILIRPPSTRRFISRMISSCRSFWLRIVTPAISKRRLSLPDTNRLPPEKRLHDDS